MGIYLLILVVLIQLFGRTAMAGYFFLDKEYVAQSLCEQREIAGNTCQGKCQMRRLFEGERQFAPGSSGALLGNVEYVDAFVVTGNTLSNQPLPSSCKFLCVTATDHGVLISPRIDAPPQA